MMAFRGSAFCTMRFLRLYRRGQDTVHPASIGLHSKSLRTTWQNLPWPL